MFPMPIEAAIFESSDEALNKLGSNCMISADLDISINFPISPIMRAPFTC